MFLGSRAAAAPYVLASKLFTALYFAYFLVILPTLALFGEFSAKEVGKLSLPRQVTASLSLFAKKASPIFYANSPFKGLEKG